MKRVVYFMPLALATALFCLVGTIAQGQKSGVYRSFSDFQQDSLSYGIDCRKEKHRIRLEDFFNKKFITVIHRDEKVWLKKSAIYAVLYCDGSLQRFSGKQHYRVEEQGVVWIFSKEINVAHGKGGTHREKRFFFSKTGDGAIQPLTLLNLKNTFPKRRDLHDELDQWFKRDADLSTYDSYHGKFKINHLLEKFFS